MVNSSVPSNQVDNQPQDFVVSIEEATLRLDQFLVKKFPQTSRAYWKAERLKKIRVNGKPSQKGQSLKFGDLVSVPMPPERPQYWIKKNTEIKVPIIYQDPYLLIVNKSAGLPTYPLKAEESETLLNAIAVIFPEQWEWGRTSREAGLIHRLDTGTSGLLILARNVDIQEQLKSLQKAGGIEKTYFAWVEGEVSGKGQICRPIAHHPHNQKKMFLPKLELCKKYAAREATTQFYVKELFLSRATSQMYTLLELKIHQGRRHQIRVHLADLGHPIVGDTLYGAKKLETYPGHLLHASKLKFVHPISNKVIEVEAPWLDNFKPIL